MKMKKIFKIIGIIILSLLLIILIYFTILKYNEKTNIYENYKTVPTKTDGKRYELLDLDKGKYDLKPAGKYVNFDEWEYELIK